MAEPRFSFLSPSFDAALALAAPRSQISLLAEVLPLDNLSRCRALLPEDDPNFAVARKSAKPKAARDPNLDKFYEEEKKIKQSNIFQEIADECKDGPLSALHACMTSPSGTSRRIRVVTRGLRTIRGDCRGTLLGYDKHLNIILQDVVETYCEIENGPMVTREHGHLFIKGDGVVLVAILNDKDKGLNEKDK